MVIVSAPKAQKWGKPVQGDHQSLKIQGAAWGRKGQMSKTDEGNLQLFWLLCTLWLSLRRCVFPIPDAFVW